MRLQLPTQLSVYFMDDRRTVNAQAPLPKPLLSELELLQNDVTALLDVSFHFFAPWLFLTRTPLLTQTVWVRRRASSGRRAWSS